MGIPAPDAGAMPIVGSRMNNAGNVPPPTPDFAPQADNPFGGIGGDGPLPF